MLLLKYRITTSLCIGLVAACASGSATASTTCDILANSAIRQDELLYASDTKQFTYIQKLVAQEKYSSYQEAQSSKLDFDLSIPEYVDATLGTKSDSTNWSTNRQKFLSISVESASLNSRQYGSMKTMSESIVRAISNCAVELANLSKSGIFVSLDKWSPDTSIFSIKITRSTSGTSTWNLKGLRVNTEPKSDAECWGDGNVDWLKKKYPATVDGSMALNCTKSSMATAIVSLSNDVDAPITLRIPGVGDKWESFEGRLRSLERQVVPSGTLAYFSLSECPLGWEVSQSAIGRYIVGVSANGELGATVGTRLSDRENRATGKHSHSPKDGAGRLTARTFVGHGDAATSNGGVQSSGGDCCNYREFDTQNVPVQASPMPDGASTSGDVAGTNAPYVQLLACTKVDRPALLTPLSGVEQRAIYLRNKQ